MEIRIRDGDLLQLRVATKNDTANDISALYTSNMEIPNQSNREILSSKLSTQEKNHQNFMRRHDVGAFKRPSAVNFLIKP